MNLRRAMEFIVQSQAQSAARMDRIEGTLDRLSSKAEEHERFLQRHERALDRHEHILAAFIETIRRNERENALEHRRFREEVRALGRRMDNWLRGGRDGRGGNGRKR